MIYYFSISIDWKKVSILLAANVACTPNGMPFGVGLKQW
jgi:hypothetical protein